jgi:predicted SPOUT superfamily RNA methylase MTH1
MHKADVFPNVFHCRGGFERKCERKNQQEGKNLDFHLVNIGKNHYHPPKIVP